MHPPRSRTPGRARPDGESWRVAIADRQGAAPEFELCESASRMVRFDRAALTLALNVDDAWCLQGSDHELRQLVRQEQTVLQGPHCDVLTSGRTTRVEDLTETGERWPLLEACGALDDTVLGSVLVVPLGRSELQHGGSPIGLLTVARDDRSPFSDQAAGELGAVADQILVRLLARWRTSQDLDDLTGQVHDDRHLAAGLLSGLLNVPVADALSIMRAQAFGSGRTLHDVARDVVAALGEPNRPS